MGVFKSLATLSKLSRTINDHRDVGADMTRMQTYMESAAATMASMSNRVGSTAAIDGTPGAALVLAARNTGGSFNLDPLVELELLVMTVGTPTPVELTEVVPQLHQHLARAGTTLMIKVGNDPHDLFIDWIRS